MAASQPSPSPIRIEYPLKGYKRDEPTGGGNAPQGLDHAIQTMLTNSTEGQLPDNPQLELVAFDNSDGSTCYRNSTLTLLMNLKPILNFIYVATNGHTGPPNSLTRLRKIADVYWDAQRTLTQRVIDLQPLVNDWFNHICRTRFLRDDGSHFPSWNDEMQQNTQSDPVDFSGHWLDRVHDAELFGNSQRVLEQLLKVKMVSRRAYECVCKNKHRQPFGDSDANLWCLSVAADAAQTPLDGLIAKYVYDDSPDFRGDCPSCGLKETHYHQYTKLMYFPEMLLIGITRTRSVLVTDRKTKRSYNTIQIDNQADTNMPDKIDLSYLLDHPQPGDEDKDNSNKGQYQLQAVVAYQGNAGGRSGHYITYIRRPNGGWTMIDEFSNHQGVDIGPLVIRPRFKARMLAYVRIPNKKLTANDQNSTRVPASGQQGDGPVAQQKSTIPQHEGTNKSSDVYPLNDQTRGSPPKLPQASQPTAQLPTQQASQPKTQLPTQQAPQPKTQLLTQQSSQQVQESAGSARVQQDITSWSEQKLKTELKARGIGIGGLRLRTKLAQRWTDYHNADQDGKLKFLLKDELKRLAKAAGLDDLAESRQAKNEDLINAIVGHGRLNLSKADTATTATTFATNDALQPVPQSGTVAASTTGVDTVTGGTASSNVTKSANIQDANVQLTADNAKLTAEVQQLKKDVSTLRSSLQIANSEKARLADQITDLSAQLTTVTATLVQAQAALSEAQRPGQAQLDTPTAQAASSATHGSTQAQPRASAIPETVQVEQGIMVETVHQPQCSNTSVVLKITTKEVFEDIDGNLEDDYKYISVPSYLSGRYLITSQWWERVEYMPDGSTSDMDKQHKIIVYVTVQNQNGTPAAAYRFDIELGLIVIDSVPHPRLDVELLSVEALQKIGDKIGKDVKVIRAPVAPPADQQAGQTRSIHTHAATPVSTQPSDSPAAVGTKRSTPEGDGEGNGEEQPERKRQRSDDGTVNGDGTEGNESTWQPPDVSSSPLLQVQQPHQQRHHSAPPQANSTANLFPTTAPRSVQDAANNFVYWLPPIPDFSTQSQQQQQQEQQPPQSTNSSLIEESAPFQAPISKLPDYLLTEVGDFRPPPPSPEQPPRRAPAQPVIPELQHATHPPTCQPLADITPDFHPATPPTLSLRDSPLDARTSAGATPFVANSRQYDSFRDETMTDYYGSSDESTMGFRQPAWKEGQNIAMQFAMARAVADAAANTNVNATTSAPSSGFVVAPTDSPGPDIDDDLPVESDIPTMDSLFESMDTPMPEYTTNIKNGNGDKITVAAADAGAAAIATAEQSNVDATIDTDIDTNTKHSTAGLDDLIMSRGQTDQPRPENNNNNIDNDGNLFGDSDEANVAGYAGGNTGFDRPEGYLSDSSLAPSSGSDVDFTPGSDPSLAPSSDSPLAPDADSPRLSKRTAYEGEIDIEGVPEGEDDESDDEEVFVYGDNGLMQG